MYQVKNKDELRQIIEDGKIPLDTIDTSKITDMSNLFWNVYKINGSISSWDVSNVENMYGIFQCSNFNQDISKWDVSKVENMNGMFAHSPFNQDISSWNVLNVKNMEYMFIHTSFSKNLGAWDLSNKISTDMFNESSYSLMQYIKDRESYLIHLEIKKETSEKKELSDLNKELNKDIELDTLEMEF